MPDTNAKVYIDANANGVLKDALEMAFGPSIPMKEAPEDVEVRDRTFRIARDELRSFVERYERLDAEKQDIADQQKVVMAEAKARGYDTKALRKVISLRKKDPQELAEEEAILQVYREALGV